jgi:hypothetical protein
MGPEATRHTGPDERAALLPAGYSPGWHMMRTVALAFLIGGFSLWLALRAQAMDWLLMPAFFLVANAIEWAFHKNPMHRPMFPRILYRNHALIHHRAFVHDSMAIHHPKELGLIMMPWYTMLLLFAMASPVAILGAWWRGPGVAGIFYLAAALYFLVYETLHALYHLPGPTLRRMGLGGRHLFEALKSHHRHHHRLDRMAQVNFNVTFPLMDWLLGTRERETEVASAPQEARI